MFCVIRNLRELNFEPVKFRILWILMIMKFINKAIGKEGNGLSSFQEELKLGMVVLNSFALERFSFIWSYQQGYKAQCTIENSR